MKKALLLTGIFISSVFVACGQSQQDEILRLQKLVNEKEQLAAQNAASARKAEAELRVARYYAIASELAEQSIEVQDKEIAALMAVQAYNFNMQYDAGSFKNKIYHALFEALKRYELFPKNVRTEAEDKYLLTNSKPILSAMLPDSSHTVVADQNGNLKFVKQGITVRTLSGHRAQVDQIQFSHSGKFMATSGKDNTIRIWSLSHLNIRPLVITETDQITKLMFSRDDAYIFYARGVKKANINQWPLDVKLMAADLCSVLTRNFTKEEWTTYVANDLPYESTCAKHPSNNK